MIAHTSIRPVEEKAFRAEAVIEDGGLSVYFTGTADMNVKSQVDSFLCEVHAEACRTGIATVVVDLSALEFINSSFIKGFVTWITAVQAMANGRYRISFLFKAARDWQRRSVGALSRLANDVVSSRPSDKP